jgi:hypothetical protein
LIGKATERAQDKRLFLPCREPIEFRDEGRQLFIEDRLFGRVRWRRRRSVPGGRAVALAAVLERPALVPGNRAQPRTRPCRSHTRKQTLVGEQKCLLSGVLRLVGIT